MALGKHLHSEVRAEKMWVRGNLMLLDVGLDDTFMLRTSWWCPHRISFTVQLHIPVGISSSVLETPGTLLLGSHLLNLGGQGGRHSVYIFNFS